MQTWANVVLRGSVRLNCDHLASQAMRPSLFSTRSCTSSDRGWALVKFGLTCWATIGPGPGCMRGFGGQGFVGCRPRHSSSQLQMD